MGTDLFKYIFDESKKDGCKGVVLVIIKVVAFFIALSPVFMCFLLYKPNIITTSNIFISGTLILGCSSLLFFIIFLCSKVFSSILLERKIKTNPEMNDEECEHYYFNKSFIITTVFQAILTVFILINHYIVNRNINIKQFKELFIVILVIFVFILIAFVVWIISLVRYIRVLENEKNYINKEESFNIDISNINMLINSLKNNERLINDIIILLEKYKEDINKS